MTENTGTQPLPGAAAPAVRPSGGVDSALEWFWHLLTSMKLSLVLMFAFAGLTLLGTIIVQAPAGAMDDAQFRAQFLNEMRLKYGGLAGVFETLQLYTVFTSVWLRFTGALMAASLVACTVQRIPGTWRNMTKPHVAVGEAFFEHAPQHEAMIFQKDPDEVLAATQAVLRKRGYRTLTEGNGTVHLYFDRNRWQPWSGLFAHISIPVVLLGALIGSLAGFRIEGFVIAEGKTVDIPNRPGATVTLNSFTVGYDPVTDDIVDYLSDVTVKVNGAEIARHDLRVNTPLRYEGIAFYQSSYGNTAQMTVKDAAGNTVFSEGVALENFGNGQNPVGFFTVPGTGQIVNVYATLGGGDANIKPGQVYVAVFDSGTATTASAQQVIDQGKPTTLGSLTFIFDKEARFTSLTVASDPGMPVIWLGFTLLVLGFAVRLYVPYRRMWARLTPRSGGAALSVAAVGRRDTGFDNEFTSIVTDIRQAVIGQAQS